MNPDVFFKNFELLADAPNGVQKLRELILQLAVMGKLVPQDPNDEPASVLIERIKAEKVRSINSKKIRESQSLFIDQREKEPFPNGWENSVLGDCIELVSGQHLGQDEQNYLELGLPYLTGPADFGPLHPTATRWTEKPKVTAKKNDVLITVKGAGVGKTNILNLDEASIGRQLMAIRPICLDYKFVYLLILASYNKFQESSTGSTVPGIGREDILDFCFGLPPLAEQKRIVSKVDELMALCDKLEARRQKKQEIQSKLNNAALDRMLGAENQEEFEQCWQRICENFDLLYDNPENVEKLKKYILQLGVEGKLVPTESEIAKIGGRDYESEDDLIKRILINYSEKEENSKNKSTFESIVSNSGETLPEGWVWTSIGQVAECLDHMRVPVNKKEREERVGNIPYYGANGRVGWIDNFIFDEPLVLVVEDETFIGRQKPFCYKIVGKSWVNNHAHVLRPTGAVDVDFLNYSLAYYPFIPLTSGTTGRKKLTKSTLIAAPYKLPPLAEQKRIVEKVEQFMGLCNELESKLRKSREDSEKLMEAVVKGLLNGAAA